MLVSVAARSSPLSKKQVREVLEEIRPFYPSLAFETTWLLSRGDKDKKTSLRGLDKTDFFTREVDLYLLEGKARIGIHSAKDLPDPLPKGLKVVAYTYGLDPRDSLVFRALPEAPLVATSSLNREKLVLKHLPLARFVDLRGTIGERLEKMDQKEVDAVVVAEAALIRLGFTHLTRFFLDGPTTPMQGRLAVVARENDVEMADVFSKINY